MRIQMDQLQAWFCMVAYLIDGQANLTNIILNLFHLFLISFTSIIFKVVSHLVPVFQHDYFFKGIVIFCASWKF